VSLTPAALHSRASFNASVSAIEIGLSISEVLSTLSKPISSAVYVGFAEALAQILTSLAGNVVGISVFKAKVSLSFS